jgi:hypothetical protein
VIVVVSDQGWHIEFVEAPGKSGDPCGAMAAEITGGVAAIVLTTSRSLFRKSTN